MKLWTDLEALDLSALPVRERNHAHGGDHEEVEGRRAHDCPCRQNVRRGEGLGLTAAGFWVCGSEFWDLGFGGGEGLSLARSQGLGLGV